MKIELVTVLALALLSPCLTKGQVTVFPDQPAGPVRDMHGVNNPPTPGRINWFKAAHIPYMRPHDAAHYSSYGGAHTIDITGIFPDFSKDPDDPASYDFHYTDQVLANTVAADCKILYRLGQSIEHGKGKKYGVIPPADYLKWAKICEHVIRHCNEGWANGHRWNIRYWEIWNEPDIERGEDRWKTDPRMWGGPKEEFYKFYCVAAKHLKKCFPDLMIGGPAVTGGMNAEGIAWIDGFFKAINQEKAPLDFFSWHSYAKEPAQVLRRNEIVDSLLTVYGRMDAESILDEWNYVIQWTETSPESAKVRFTEKAAAFIMATMISVQQETRVEKMMFYDFRPSTSYNNVFDPVDGKPLSAYYPFYIWGKLAEYGETVKVEVDEPNLYAVAARNPEGRLRIAVCRYTDDNNDLYSKVLYLNVAGRNLETTVGKMTDAHYLYTEIPVFASKGRLQLYMEPRSFLMIDL